LSGERIDPTGLNLEERIIDIWRCAAVVKGGRRFSFASMVVVGNGQGVVGLGYGKAREVPQAIEKAVKDARKNLVRVPVYGTTIPHEVRGKFSSALVQMIPALPGTGVIAGQVVRSILECVGVHDILSKSVGGTNNPKNLAKATLEGLLMLRGREDVARMRGVEIPEDPVLAQSLKAQPPKRREWEERGERGGGDRRRGPSPGRGRGPGRGPGAGSEGVRESEGGAGAATAEAPAKPQGKQDQGSGTGPA
jgi:small subunit ribosomal protein S5